MSAPLQSLDHLLTQIRDGQRTFTDRVVQIHLPLTPHALDREPTMVEREYLHRVQILDIFGTSLDADTPLPPWVHELLINLVVIIVHAPFESLPEEIVDLADRSPFFDTLMLRSNHMSELPASVRRILPKLKTLILDRNEMTEIPDMVREAVNLEQLSLSSNAITTIPDWLPDSLPKLSDLNVSDNPLDMSTLATVGRMHQLAYLHLNHVGLTSDALACMGALRKLEFVNIAANHLTEDPTPLLPPTCSVDASQNPFCARATKRSRPSPN
jgi:Leucine-rich repeat (LRR) protein